MRVLLTGASGFIGRCVWRKLTESGFQVWAVVRRDGRTSESGFRSCADGHVVAVDLCEPKALERALPVQPDLVVHLAASIPGSFLGADATKAAAVNRIIDENVYMACKAFGVGAVYASSTSVYGLGDGTVKSEASAVRPIGPYAVGKLASERLGEELLARSDLPFTVLRINAPYGPGQRSRTVLRLFIERAIEGTSLRYHGTGSRAQDFTFIEDVGDAMVSAVKLNQAGIYNISAGQPISMRDLARLVIRCVPNCRSTIEASGENDPQEASTARFSIEKARSQLAWCPRVSLESGIRALVNRLVDTQREDRASI